MPSALTADTATTLPRGVKELGSVGNNKHGEASINHWRVMN